MTCQSRAIPSNPGFPTPNNANTVFAKSSATSGDIYWVRTKLTTNANSMSPTKDARQRLHDVPKSVYNYYRNLDHTSKDYAKYISDEGSRKYLSGLATKFRDGGSTKGYSDSENVMNVIAFVQSLPYTSDSVTTGHDEYPRYPIETLVDNGGDCEDTALLTAGILREMGYGVVLLGLPGHMAVGVKGGQGVTGTYYTYNGVKYYYLETTANGWDIGEVPDAHRNSKAKIIPV